MRRTGLYALALAIFLATAFSAEAQQPGTVSRLGYVASAGNITSDASFAALREGLRDLGHIDGKNIVFDYRSAEGNPERMPSLVAELIQHRVDILFCPNLPAAHAAKGATRTILAVMVSNVDPVELGIVSSFARPGGNITGLTLQSLELAGKRLELLKEIFPKLKRVGLVRNTENQSMNLITKQVQAAAPAIGMRLQTYGVRDPEDIGESAN